MDTSAVEAGRERHHVVVPYDASNSSVRTRAVTWRDRLLDAGRLEPGDVVFHGPGFDGRRVPDRANVLLLRNVGRFTRGRREAGLLRGAALGVYDLDDGLPWDDGKLPGLGRWWKRPWPRSLVAARAAAASDRMIVGNEVLADWAVERCSDVRVVPTCVEPGRYRRRTAWTIDRPLIGWIGSPATTGYVADVLPALRDVCARTGARVELIGADPAVVGPFADIATVRPWNEADALDRLASWDVGLMPLRDGVYERAKCGYKLLQYAAAGVPSVGSPVGVNEPLLTAMDGLAPATLDDWADAVCHIVAEPADRRAGRAAAGFAVADVHSYDHWQDRWVDAVGWTLR